MKSYTTLIKGARLVVEECFTVQTGDAVLIVCDEDHRREAEAMAGVAVSLGAFPVIADITHHVSAALKSMAVSMEPAKNLAAAEAASDVVIITTAPEYMMRIAHTNSIGAAVKNKAKVGSVEAGMADWDLTKADIDEIVRKSEALMAATEGGEWVRVTNPAGTDVKICIKDRPALEIVPVKGPGDMIGVLPLWGEVAWAAVEDKTEGVIVFDGIMVGVGVEGQVKDPIVLKIKEGRAVEITGGVEAERLRAVIASSDKNANIIAELGVGTSEKEVLGSVFEKGKLGTVHFGIGDNMKCYPGGCSSSKYHLDGSCRDVTIEVDGRVVVKDGVMVV